MIYHQALCKKRVDKTVRILFWFIKYKKFREGDKTSRKLHLLDFLLNRLPIQRYSRQLCIIFINIW